MPDRSPVTLNSGDVLVVPVDPEPCDVCDEPLKRRERRYAVQFLLRNNGLDLREVVSGHKACADGFAKRLRESLPKGIV